MNRKVAVALFLLFFSVLFIGQTSIASAKPVNVAFEQTSWISDSTQWVQVSEKVTVITVIGHGEIAGDISGPFTWSDTITQYYDAAGNLRYTTYKQLIEIQTSNGDLVLQAKVKIYPDTPFDEATGTWKVVYGTGLMGAISGGGTYYAWFKFDGVIR
jgi:hypothetical protein